MASADAGPHNSDSAGGPTAPSLSTGAVVGIAVGSVLVALLVLGAGIFWMWRRKMKRGAGEAQTRDGEQEQGQGGREPGPDGTFEKVMLHGDSALPKAELETPSNKIELPTRVDLITSAEVPAEHIHNTRRPIDPVELAGNPHDYTFIREQRTARVGADAVD